MRQLRRELSIRETTIILTATARDEMTVDYLAQMVDFAGGDYFLARPYDRQVLLRLLTTLPAEGSSNPSPSRPVFPTRVVLPTCTLPVTNFLSN